MPVQQVTTVSCPSCRTTFNTPFENIINAQELSLKMAFLQGRLNIAQCPQCGTVSPIQAPLLYYDLEKEFAFAYMPGGLNVTLPEQEKAIGNLTNTLMKQLEPEQKKFYLFNPKIFIKLDSLVNEVLEGDGITAEMRASHEAKAKLLQELLQTEGEAVLRAKVAARAAELDSDFFEIMTAMMQTAHYEGNQPFAQALLTLRTFLAEIQPSVVPIIDAIDAELGLIILKDRPDLLKRLTKAENEDEFESLISVGQGLLDYTFFQELTVKIDQAQDKTEAETLTALRTKILDSKSKQEAMSRAAFEKSAELLKEVLQSRNPEQVLAGKLDQIDQSFFALISAHIEQAQQRQQPEAAQAMQMIAQITLAMLQERENAQMAG